VKIVLFVTMAEGGVDPDDLFTLEIPMISVEDTSDYDSEQDTKICGLTSSVPDLASSDPQPCLLASSRSASNSSAELMRTASSSLTRSNSFLPAWKRNIEIVRMATPPSPKRKRSGTMSEMISSIWNKFQAPRVSPVGVSPCDAECDNEYVPIVYSKHYDIQGKRRIGFPKQTILFNKPARVFAKLVKGKCISHVHDCNDS